MEQKEKHYPLLKWQLALAFCLASFLSLVACNSLPEQPVKPTPTHVPTPFPASQFYFPIPAVENLAGHDDCVQAPSTSLVALGAFYPTEVWPYSEVVEINLSLEPGKSEETTAVLLPREQAINFGVGAMYPEDAVVGTQFTHACDPERIIAELIKGRRGKHINDNVFRADYKTGSLIPQYRSGVRFVETLKFIHFYRGSSLKSLEQIVMKIVP